MKLTKQQFEARKKAAMQFSKLSLLEEQKQIKESGGMKHHHFTKDKPSNKPVQSLYTVGGVKVLHKQTGGDKITQQIRYANFK